MLSKHFTKYIGKSLNYKNVYSYSTFNNTIEFNGKILGLSKCGFLTERDAALWVDKTLIRNGKQPINILILKK